AGRIGAKRKTYAAGNLRVWMRASESGRRLPVIANGNATFVGIERHDCGWFAGFAGGAHVRHSAKTSFWNFFGERRRNRWRNGVDLGTAQGNYGAIVGNCAGAALETGNH